MAAPTPTIHIFEEINAGKYSSVRHYLIERTLYGESLLTNHVNISENQKFAKSNPDYWLKVKPDKKWSDNITGLFPTNFKGVYCGDINKRQHLLIFVFSEERDFLTILYYKNFYTKEIDRLIMDFLNKKRGL